MALWISFLGLIGGTLSLDGPSFIHKYEKLATGRPRAPGPHIAQPVYQSRAPLAYCYPNEKCSDAQCHHSSFDYVTLGDETLNRNRHLPSADSPGESPPPAAHCHAASVERMVPGQGVNPTIDRRGGFEYSATLPQQSDFELYCHVG